MDGSYISFASGGGGGNQNLDNTYEFQGPAVGFQSITAGNVAKGTATAVGSTTANAWKGFWFLVGPASAGSTRYLVDISFDNASTYAVQNLYCEANSATGPSIAYFIPLAVSSGAVIKVRVQGSGGTPTFVCALLGIVSNAQSPPMYTTMTALDPDTANTRGSTVDISAVASGSTTYGTVIPSTAGQYGAILMIPGGGTNTAATAQQVSVKLATGVAASEVVIAVMPTYIISASANSFRTQSSFLVSKTIAASTRLSAQFMVSTPGTDAFRLALYGFS